MDEVDLLITTIHELIKEERLTEEELLKRTRCVMVQRYDKIVPENKYIDARVELSSIVALDENYKLYIL